MGAIVSDLLPFTAHRVELAPGIWTIPGGGGEDPFESAATLALLEHTGGDLEGKRVLDVGCLEGGYTIAFARLIAKVADQTTPLKVAQRSVRRAQKHAEARVFDVRVLGDVLGGCEVDFRDAFGG